MSFEVKIIVGTEIFLRFQVFLDSLKKDPEDLVKNYYILPYPLNSIQDKHIIYITTKDQGKKQTDKKQK